MLKTIKNNSLLMLLSALLIACQQENPQAIARIPPDAVISKEYNKEGTLKAQGAVINGKKEGMWIFYDWPNTDKIGREEIYQNGKLNGQAISYLGNGDTLSIGNYIDGKQEGLWKQFQGGQMLRSIGHYSKDEKVGEWKYYSDYGKLMKRILYKDGKEIILEDNEPPLPPQ